jgi:hypothetical protein
VRIRRKGATGRDCLVSREFEVVCTLLDKDAGMEAEAEEVEVEEGDEVVMLGGCSIYSLVWTDRFDDKPGKCQVDMRKETT